jgi:putative NADH-flavin reductase
MAERTIALIGATGRTGSEFVKLALEDGFTVKALVRTPSKVTIDDERLTLIEGDLQNLEAIEKVTEGASYVVCMAAASTLDGEYPKEFMFEFVKRLYPISKNHPESVPISSRQYVNRMAMVYSIRLHGQ